MNKTAVITGAGSGVGRAIAQMLAAEGWQLALLGRHFETLEETKGLAGERSKIVCYVCDVAKTQAVTDVAERIISDFGDVEVLVNSAGTNVRDRLLDVLSAEDYHAMIDTNLHGAFYCVQAFLPGMRARGSGTIVNIISDAGKQASPKAGPGYAMSKFGLAGLTQSINAEERSRGIRASGVFPGDIDTPLLERRPQPPDAAARAQMLQAEDVAKCAVFCISLPPRVIVEEILVRPR